MVWGCIMHGVKGPLVVLEYLGGQGGGMESNQYREQVLERVLLELDEDMKKKKWVIYFQQDGAPSHTSKATKKWCEDHKIKLFPHPPLSPDVIKQLSTRPGTI
jgi:hypothetical protein